MSLHINIPKIAITPEDEDDDGDDNNLLNLAEALTDVEELFEDHASSRKNLFKNKLKIKVSDNDGYNTALEDVEASDEDDSIPTFVLHHCPISLEDIDMEQYSTEEKYGIAKKLLNDFEYLKLQSSNSNETFLGTSNETSDDSPLTDVEDYDTENEFQDEIDIPNSEIQMDNSDIMHFITISDEIQERKQVPSRQNILECDNPSTPFSISLLEEKTLKQRKKPPTFSQMMKCKGNSSHVRIRKRKRNKTNSGKVNGQKLPAGNDSSENETTKPEGLKYGLQTNSLNYESDVEEENELPFPVCKKTFKKNIQHLKMPGFDLNVKTDEEDFECETETFRRRVSVDNTIFQKQLDEMASCYSFTKDKNESTQIKGDEKGKICFSNFKANATNMIEQDVEKLLKPTKQLFISKSLIEDGEKTDIELLSDTEERKNIKPGIDSEYDTEEEIFKGPKNAIEVFPDIILPPPTRTRIIAGEKKCLVPTVRIMPLDDSIEMDSEFEEASTTDEVINSDTELTLIDKRILRSPQLPIIGAENVKMSENFVDPMHNKSMMEDIPTDFEDLNGETKRVNRKVTKKILSIPNKSSVGYFTDLEEIEMSDYQSDEKVFVGSDIEGHTDLEYFGSSEEDSFAKTDLRGNKKISMNSSFSKPIPQGFTDTEDLFASAEDEIDNCTFHGMKKELHDASSIHIDTEYPSELDDATPKEVMYLKGGGFHDINTDSEWFLDDSESHIQDVMEAWEYFSLTDVVKAPLKEERNAATNAEKISISQPISVREDKSVSSVHRSVDISPVSYESILFPSNSQMGCSQETYSYNQIDAMLEKMLSVVDEFDVTTDNHTNSLTLEPSSHALIEIPIRKCRNKKVYTVTANIFVPENELAEPDENAVRIYPGGDDKTDNDLTDEIEFSSGDYLDSFYKDDIYFSNNLNINETENLYEPVDTRISHNSNDPDCVWQREINRNLSTVMEEDEESCGVNDNYNNNDARAGSVELYQKKNIHETFFGPIENTDYGSETSRIFSSVSTEESDSDSSDRMIRADVKLVITSKKDGLNAIEVKSVKECKSDIDQQGEKPKNKIYKKKAEKEKLLYILDKKESDSKNMSQMKPTKLKKNVMIRPSFTIPRIFIKCSDFEVSSSEDRKRNNDIIAKPNENFPLAINQQQGNNENKQTEVDVFTNQPFHASQNEIYSSLNTTTYVPPSDVMISEAYCRWSTETEIHGGKTTSPQYLIEVEEKLLDKTLDPPFVAYPNPELKNLKSHSKKTNAFPQFELESNKNNSFGAKELDKNSPMDSKEERIIIEKQESENSKECFDYSKIHEIEYDGAPEVNNDFGIRKGETKFKTLESIQTNQGTYFIGIDRNKNLTEDLLEGGWPNQQCQKADLTLQTLSKGNQIECYVSEINNQQLLETNEKTIELHRMRKSIDGNIEYNKQEEFNKSKERREESQAVPNIIESQEANITENRLDVQFSDTQENARHKRLPTGEYLESKVKDETYSIPKTERKNYGKNEYEVEVQNYNFIEIERKPKISDVSEDEKPKYLMDKKEINQNGSKSYGSPSKINEIFDEFLCDENINYNDAINVHPQTSYGLDNEICHEKESIANSNIITKSYNTSEQKNPKDTIQENEEHQRQNSPDEAEVKGKPTFRKTDFSNENHTKLEEITRNLLSQEYAQYEGDLKQIKNTNEERIEEIPFEYQPLKDGSNEIQVASRKKYENKLFTTIESGIPKTDISGDREQNEFSKDRSSKLKENTAHFLSQEKKEYEDGIHLVSRIEMRGINENLYADMLHLNEEMKGESNKIEKILTEKLTASLTSEESNMDFSQENKQAFYQQDGHLQNYSESKRITTNFLSEQKEKYEDGLYLTKKIQIQELKGKQGVGIPQEHSKKIYELDKTKESKDSLVLSDISEDEYSKEIAPRDDKSNQQHNAEMTISCSLYPTSTPAQNGFAEKEKRAEKNLTHDKSLYQLKYEEDLQPISKQLEHMSEPTPSEEITSAKKQTSVEISNSTKQEEKAIIRKVGKKQGKEGSMKDCESEEILKKSYFELKKATSSFILKENEEYEDGLCKSSEDWIECGTKKIIGEELIQVLPLEPGIQENKQPVLKECRAIDQISESEKNGMYQEQTTGKASTEENILNYVAVESPNKKRETSSILNFFRKNSEKEDHKSVEVLTETNYEKISELKSEALSFPLRDKTKNEDRRCEDLTEGESETVREEKPIQLSLRKTWEQPNEKTLLEECPNFMQVEKQYITTIEKQENIQMPSLCEFIFSKPISITRHFLDIERNVGCDTSTANKKYISGSTPRNLKSHVNEREDIFELERKPSLQSAKDERSSCNDIAAAKTFLIFEKQFYDSPEDMEHIKNQIAPEIGNNTEFLEEEQKVVKSLNTLQTVPWTEDSSRDSQSKVIPISRDNEKVKTIDQIGIIGTQTKMSKKKGLLGFLKKKSEDNNDRYPSDKNSSDSQVKHKKKSIPEEKLEDSTSHKPTIDDENLHDPNKEFEMVKNIVKTSDSSMRKKVKSQKKTLNEENTTESKRGILGFLFKKKKPKNKGESFQCSYYESEDFLKILEETKYFLDEETKIDHDMTPSKDFNLMKQSNITEPYVESGSFKDNEDERNLYENTQALIDNEVNNYFGNATQSNAERTKEKCHMNIPEYTAFDFIKEEIETFESTKLPNTSRVESSIRIETEVENIEGGPPKEIITKKIIISEKLLKMQNASKSNTSEKILEKLMEVNEDLKAQLNIETSEHSEQDRPEITILFETPEYIPDEEHHREEDDSTMHSYDIMKIESKNMNKVLKNIQDKPVVRNVVLDESNIVVDVPLLESVTNSSNDEKNEVVTDLGEITSNELSFTYPQHGKEIEKEFRDKHQKSSNERMVTVEGNIVEQETEKNYQHSRINNRVNSKFKIIENRNCEDRSPHKKAIKTEFHDRCETSSEVMQVPENSLADSKIQYNPYEENKHGYFDHLNNPQFQPIFSGKKISTPETIKRQPLFRIESEEENFVFDEDVDAPFPMKKDFDNLLRELGKNNAQVNIIDMKPESKIEVSERKSIYQIPTRSAQVDIETIESKLRDLGNALDALEMIESEVSGKNEVREKKLRRVERKFERMASETDDFATVTNQTVELSKPTNHEQYQQLVSHLSQDEVASFQGDYNNLWDEYSLSRSDEWDSNTPESQADVLEFPQDASCKQLTDSPQKFQTNMQPPQPRPRHQKSQEQIDNSIEETVTLTKQISPVRDDLLDESDKNEDISYQDKKKFWENIAKEPSKKQSEIITPSKRNSIQETCAPPVPKPRAILQFSYSVSEKTTEKVLVEEPKGKMESTSTDFKYSSNLNTMDPHENFQVCENIEGKLIPSDPQDNQYTEDAAQKIHKTDSVETDTEGPEETSSQGDNAGYISDSGDVEQYISDSEIEDRVPQIRERQMSVFFPSSVSQKSRYERSASLPTEDLYEVSARSTQMRKQYYEEQIKKEMIKEQLTIDLEDEGSPERKSIASPELKSEEISQISSEKFPTNERMDSTLDSEHEQFTEKNSLEGENNSIVLKNETSEIHVDKSETEKSEKLIDEHSKATPQQQQKVQHQESLTQDNIPEITVTLSGKQRRISEESDEYTVENVEKISPVLEQQEITSEDKKDEISEKQKNISTEVSVVSEHSDTSRNVPDEKKVSGENIEDLSDIDLESKDLKTIVSRLENMHKIRKLKGFSKSPKTIGIKEKSTEREQIYSSAKYSAEEVHDQTASQNQVSRDPQHAGSQLKEDQNEESKSSEHSHDHQSKIEVISEEKMMFGSEAQMSEKSETAVKSHGKNTITHSQEFNQICSEAGGVNNDQGKSVSKSHKDIGIYEENLDRLPTQIKNSNEELEQAHFVPTVAHIKESPIYSQDKIEISQKLNDEYPSQNITPSGVLEQMTVYSEMYQMKSSETRIPEENIEQELSQIELIDTKRSNSQQTTSQLKSIEKDFKQAEREQEVIDYAENPDSFMKSCGEIKTLEEIHETNIPIESESKTENSSIQRKEEMLKESDRVEEMRKVRSSESSRDPDSPSEKLVYESEKQTQSSTIINQPEENTDDTIWEVSVESEVLKEEELTSMPSSCNRKSIKPISDSISDRMNDNKYSVENTTDEINIQSGKFDQEVTDSLVSNKLKYDDHNDMKNIILESLNQQKVDPEEAKIIAESIMEEIESEIQKVENFNRRLSSKSESSESEKHVTDYIKELADAKGLDQREVELVESVLQRHQRQISKLCRGDTQASSMEITDEDLRYSEPEYDDSNVLQQQMGQLEAEHSDHLKNVYDSLVEDQRTIDISSDDITTMQSDDNSNIDKKGHTSKDEQLRSEKSYNNKKDIILEEDENITDSLTDEPDIAMVKSYCLGVENRILVQSQNKTEIMEGKNQIEQVTRDKYSDDNAIVNAQGTIFSDLSEEFCTKGEQNIYSVTADVAKEKFPILNSNIETGANENVVEQVADVSAQCDEKENYGGSIKRTSSSDSKSSMGSNKTPDDLYSTCSSSKITDFVTSSEIVLRKSKEHDGRSFRNIEKKSGIDLESYSSSGESHYHSFEIDSRSRPCSSDLEGIMPTGSSEYESALNSQELSIKSQVTSGEYHTAISSLSSKESMMSIESESSGNLASIEVSENSETLVPSNSDIEADIDIVDQQLFEDGELWQTTSEFENNEIISEDQSTQISSIPLSSETIDIPSKMKRSYEMTFQPEPKMLATDSPQTESNDIDERCSTSFDDGSVLSVSTSSAQLKTVIELSRTESGGPEESMTSAFSDHLSLEDGDLLAKTSENIVFTDSSTSTYEEPKEFIESVTILSATITNNGISSVCSQVTTETLPSSVTQKLNHEELKKKGHRRQESTSFIPSLIHGVVKTSEQQTLVEDEQEPDTDISIEKSEIRYEKSMDLSIRRESTERRDSHGKSSNTSSEKSSFEEAEAEAAFSMVAHISPVHKLKQICPIIEDVDAEKNELEAKEVAERERVQRANQIKDSSPGSIPDIKVTEHMAPLDESKFRYPELEIEREELEQENKNTPNSETSHALKDTRQYSNETEDIVLGGDQIQEEKSHETIEAEPIKPEEIGTDNGPSIKGTNEEERGSDSPNSDSFELIEKPDIIDDFVVIEEIGKEASEMDSEGKSMAIQAKPKSHRKTDEEIDAYLARSDPTPLTKMTELKYFPDTELEFEFEDSPPQTKGDTTTRDYGSRYDQELEANRKWIEKQFHGDHAAMSAAGYGYEMEFERGPLEDIKEEDMNDIDLASSRIGSLGSQKESGGSLGSIRDSYSSTPEYDVLAGRRYFTRSGEHDDISMSSLQEFENLERAMSLETKRIHHGSGSQESSSNGSFKTRYYTCKGQCDDVSASSLKEFEGLEKACIAVHKTEIKVKEEEELLSQIEEVQESLSNETEKIEKVSTEENKVTESDEEDYEKRMFEIDEIIRQAQNNVERFIDLKEPEKTESLGRGDSIEEVSKVPDLDLDAPLNIFTTETPNNNNDPMVTSTDSLDIEQNKPLQYGSTDSLDKKNTEIDIMTASTDSIECNDQLDKNVTTDSIETKTDGSNMICSDSLDIGAAMSFRPQRDSLDEDEPKLFADHSSSDTGKDLSSSGRDDAEEQLHGLMLGSTDISEPTSSTATHATYQYETDSVFSGSFTSGGSNTMVSSTDTIDPNVSKDSIDIAAAVRKVWFEEGSMSSEKNTTTELFEESSMPYVTEVIEPSEKLEQFIKDFGSNIEQRHETEETDVDGNVHTRTIIQKHFVVKSGVEATDLSKAIHTEGKSLNNCQQFEISPFQLTTLTKTITGETSQSCETPEITISKARAFHRRPLRYDISVDDQTEVDPREHDWLFNLTKDGQQELPSEMGDGQMRHLPKDQHQLSSEMRELLKEMEEASKN